MVCTLQDFFRTSAASVCFEVHTLRIAHADASLHAVPVQAWAFANTTSEQAQAHLLQGVRRRADKHGVAMPEAVYRDRCACLDGPGAQMLRRELRNPGLLARA